MKYIEELAALVAVRNYLVNCVEIAKCKITREEVKALESKTIEVERRIIDMSMKFDPGHDVKATKTFNSSVDVDQVMKAVDDHIKRKEDLSDVLTDDAEKPVEAKKAKSKVVRREE